MLCGQSPGMAYGELGPTHHSIEDLSWMRAIANLAGARARPTRPQTRAAVRWAADNPGPATCASPGSRCPTSRRRLAVPARPGRPADRRRRRHRDRRSARWSRARWRPRPSCCAPKAFGPGAQHARSSSRSTPAPSCAAAAQTARHRHRRGGHHHRRPRRRGGHRWSRSTGRRRCGSSACRGVRADRQHRVPARALRPDRRRHRRRGP